VRWSREPHELPDGTPVEGLAAAVARALDAASPLSGGTLTESQTRAEVLLFLDDFRWCEEMGWGVARGTRDVWATVTRNELYELVCGFLAARIEWASAACSAFPGDEDATEAARAYLKFCRRSDTGALARRMTEDACTLLTVPVSALDRGSTVLGTPNGTLSLETGALVPDSEEQVAFYEDRPVTYSNAPLMVTRSTRAEADSDFTGRTFATEPRWAEFVDEICDGDREKASFLQRALGYSLLGGNPEKATFVLWGPSRDNGKSTLMNAVKMALGDYADTAPAGLLLANRFDSYTSANPTLARLVGRRIVDVSEPPVGSELNGAMVKKLASGTDPVSTRALYGKEFSYVPDFTIWMHCNALPIARDPASVDPRHMFVVELTRSFGPDERDPDLWPTITSEDGLHTILEWLVAGYMDWEERGLDAPACVTRASEAWLRASGTLLDRMIEDLFDVGTGLRCDVRDFRAVLDAYARSQGEDPMGIRQANAYLRQRSIVARPSNGRRHYRGMALNAAGERLLGECETGGEDALGRTGKCTPEGGDATRIHLT